jgi:hypothetical protein
LCAEGHKIRAHRIVLSACSPYFQVCLSILIFSLKMSRGVLCCLSSVYGLQSGF